MSERREIATEDGINGGTVVKGWEWPRERRTCERGFTSLAEVGSVSVKEGSKKSIRVSNFFSMAIGGGSYDFGETTMVGAFDEAREFAIGLTSSFFRKDGADLLSLVGIPCFFMGFYAFS